MTRLLLVALATGAGLLATVPAIAATPFAGHPLVGTWRFDVPDTGCHEVYRFRTDGTSIVTSGGEIAESVFEISPTPTRDGFYAWTDTIVKDNGKQDCSGQVTTVGRKVTNYIRFDRAQNRFIVCREQSLDACFGPLRRIGGDAI